MPPQSQSRRFHSLLVIVIIALALGIIGLTVYVRSLRQEITEKKIDGPESSQHEKLLVFMDDFIKLVLNAEGEVDFETRLKLENEVRDINDPEVLTAWKAFVASGDETEAQKKVIALLQLIVKKLRT